MRKPPLKPDAQGQTGTKLLVAMTGKASAAKAAEGDEPVFAYIASLRGWGPAAYKLRKFLREGLPHPGHSTRRAIIGSVRAARRAGITAASTATSVTAAAAARNAVMSPALTPYR